MNHLTESPMVALFVASVLCACLSAAPATFGNSRLSGLSQYSSLLNELRRRGGDTSRSTRHLPDAPRDSVAASDDFPHPSFAKKSLPPVAAGSVLEESENPTKRQWWYDDYGLGGGRFGKREFDEYGLGGGRFGRDVGHVGGVSRV